MDIPLIVTEQLPEKFGKTTSTISDEFSETQKIYDKTQFSMISDEIESELKTNYSDKDTIILFGIEAHVCITQTALELLDLGYKVYAVVDAVTSIRVQDRLVGIKRMELEGVKFVSSESVIFELLRSAKSEYFKPLMPVIKDFAKNLMNHL